MGANPIRTSMIALLSKIPVVALLLLSAASVIAGDYFAKYWSLHPRPFLYILAVITYGLSGVFYTPILLRHGLVISSLAWMLLSVLGFVIIGALVFREQLTVLQWITVALGVASLVLLELGN